MKLQRLHRWCLGMDKQFHPILYHGCNNVSMLGLKLIKRGPWWKVKLEDEPWITHMELTNRGPSGDMMTSSNGNTFRVTGHLCGEFTGPRFPAPRPVTQSFDVFFDLCLNKRLSKQSWGWWFETLSHPLWRHCNKCGQLHSDMSWCVLFCPWLSHSIALIDQLVFYVLNAYLLVCGCGWRCGSMWQYYVFGFVLFTSYNTSKLLQRNSVFKSYWSASLWKHTWDTAI